MYGARRQALSTTVDFPLSQKLPALSLCWQTSLQEAGKSDSLETEQTGGEVSDSGSERCLVHFFRKGRRAEEEDGE